MNIVLTGGGTGGHVYPNLALVPDLKRAGYTPVYVGGDGDTQEKRLAEKAGLEYHGVPVIKFIRSVSPSALKNNVKIPFTLSRSVKEAEKILKDVRAAAVFSKGGFASLPAALAALKLGIPCFCHESDYTLGLANKIAVRKGAVPLKGDPRSVFEGTFTGMPLRAEITRLSRAEARKKLGISGDKKILLIMGGSSGAEYINQAVIENIDELTRKYYVIHLTGKGKKGLSEADMSNDRRLAITRRQSYAEAEYSDDVCTLIRAADACVSRAGATAVAELAAAGARALFIPLPKGISRGDQIFNAELAEEYGGHVLYQSSEFSKRLPAAIDKTFAEPPMRAIVNDANGKIVRLIDASIRRGELCTNKKSSPNG